MPNHSEPSTKTRKAWWRHLIEVLIILAVAFAIMQWQERDLLNKTDNAKAENHILVGLDQKSYQIPIANQKQLIYFFAPWCTICRFSIGNIESQKQALLDKGYQVRYVALDWKSQQEVEAFVADEKLTFPVLMGTIETMADYGVKGFPTYYLINEQGIVIAGSQGYSTSLGIWLRSLSDTH